MVGVPAAGRTARVAAVAALAAVMGCGVHRESNGAAGGPPRSSASPAADVGRERAVPGGAATGDELASVNALDSRWDATGLLVAEDFEAGLGGWRWELEQGGRVAPEGGRLEIDVPAGATVWLVQRLTGPIVIEFDAMAISAGGANDRVSDLNCFWMASDTRSPDDLFATRRSGRFADYHELLTYYVGLGGNHNTTTRLRRYIGNPEQRPMLPEHDLSDPAAMLSPNVWQRIHLVACGGLVQYYRDGRKLFELQDAEPYTSGHFAVRTTWSHVVVDRVRVYRVKRLVQAERR